MPFLIRPYRRFPVLNLPRVWPTEEGVGEQWFLSGFKGLVQHQYPGHSRNEGVAHGTLPTLESHGARRIES